MQITNKYWIIKLIDQPYQLNHDVKKYTRKLVTDQRKMFYIKNQVLSRIPFRFCNPVSRSLPIIFSMFMKSNIRFMGYFIFALNSH